MKLPLKKQFAHYFRDKWNYLDIIGCSLYTTACVLRFFSYVQKNEDLFKVARVTLCVDLCIWYMRLLHVFTFFKALGPKLVMIKKMINDLLFFLCIMAVFVCAFGITTEGETGLILAYRKTNRKNNYLIFFN
jgi:transient receptor potential cation channel subfamily M protein 2